MDWRELAARPPAWTRGGEAIPAPAGRPAPAANVLFTRVLVFRNFAGEPFPVSASPEACHRLALRASAYAASRGLGTSARLRDLGDGVLRMLRERHLIAEPPVPLPGRKGIKHLALGRDEGTFAWINEVEHLTWARVFPGLPDLADILPALAGPGGDAEGVWARSPRYGFLTSDPARAGAGLAFQAVVHLPALSLFRKLGQVHAALAALGAAFAPAARMASSGDVDSALFRVSGGSGPGPGPEAAWVDFLSNLEPVLAWEAEAQARCLEKHRKRLEAGVHTALDILESSDTLGFPRLQACISWLRLGAALGLADPRIRADLERIRIHAQSGHLEVSSSRVLSKEEEDITRASVVKLSMERYRAR